MVRLTRAVFASGELTVTRLTLRPLAPGNARTLSRKVLDLPAPSSLIVQQ